MEEQVLVKILNGIERHARGFEIRNFKFQIWSAVAQQLGALLKTAAGAEMVGLKTSFFRPQRDLNQTWLAEQSGNPNSKFALLRRDHWASQFEIFKARRLFRSCQGHRH